MFIFLTKKEARLDKESPIENGTQTGGGSDSRGSGTQDSGEKTAPPEESPSPSPETRVSQKDLEELKYIIVKAVEEWAKGA